MGDTPPATATPVEVTVVVVTYQSAEVLPACLESLPAGLKGIKGWHLVVADNASDDGSAHVATTIRPEATVLEMGRNAGYAAAINAAVAKAPPSDAILVLNADVRLRPGCGVSLLEALHRPGVGIAVPRILDDRGRVQLSLRREPTVARAWVEAIVGGRRASRLGRLGEVLGKDADYRCERPIDWATGAVMLVSRQCLDTVGDWDESFFLYSEETDFSLRARDAGWMTWFTPAAEATHRGGESNTSPELWTILTNNRVRLYRKRHGAMSSGLFWAAVVINEAVRSVPGGETHRAALRSLLRGRTTTGTLRRPGTGPATASSPPTTGWICFAGVDWWYHNQAHSDVQLMRQIARDRPVLFINSIGMRMPLPGRSTQPLRRVLRKAASVLRFLRQPLPDNPGFHVASPLVLPFYGSPRARAVNARLVRAQVRVLARRTGIELPEAVIMVTIPTAWEVVRRLPRRSLVLNRSDLHSAFDEVDQPYIRVLEDELLAHSDVVVYASHALMAAERDRTGERATFLDHGVDVDHFRGPHDEPADLASIPHPRIGFFGGIDDYVVDLELLERVALDVPNASLVIIGDATCSMDRLTALPNVHWLGYRPYEEIPAYGAGFDVALMPWLCNKWIEHANPIKLREYLALGLPIVSTRFPEVEFWRDVVAVAEDGDDFVALVRAALAGQVAGTPASRRARVANATWARQAALMLRLGEGGP